MLSITTFFRLIRWPNLIYIALTQYLLRYGILFPIYTHQAIQQPFTLSHSEFALFVLSTILVAAAGYIINDYFDVKADEINKPERIFIDRTINRRTAILWHWAFNFSGIAIGFYLAYCIGNIWLGFLHMASAAILWFYTTHLKRIALIGNLSIAFLTALVVAMVLLFEPSFFGSFLNNYPEIQAELLGIFKGYALFAFLLTLFRELVKDLEDIEGDRSVKNKTLPILLGVSTTKIFSGGIALSILGLTIYYIISQAGIHADQSFYQVKSIRYLIISVCVPLVFCLIFLFRADRAQHYNWVSKLIKIIMLAGILYLFFIMNSVS